MRLRGRCSSPKHVDYQGFFSFFETCSLQINVGQILDLGTPALKRKTTETHRNQLPTHQADFHLSLHLASHCGPVWPPDMARKVEHPPKRSAIGCKIVSPCFALKHHKTIPTKIGIDCHRSSSPELHTTGPWRVLGCPDLYLIEAVPLREKIKSSQRVERVQKMESESERLRKKDPFVYT